ncbi:MAG: hypothetical protein GEV08_23610 [Acidimicrobiia bacterium]|nr:hypothetical protein [Acidimicrobiia bacterium]
MSAAEEPGPEAYARMFELADLLTPQAMRVAVTLGLPGLLATGSRSIDELAALTGADRGGLATLAHHLTAKGVLARPEPGAVGLTEVGRTLLHPRPGCVRPRRRAGGHGPGLGRPRPHDPHR